MVGIDRIIVRKEGGGNKQNTHTPMKIHTPACFNNIGANMLYKYDQNHIFLSLSDTTSHTI